MRFVTVRAAGVLAVLCVAVVGSACRASAPDDTAATTTGAVQPSGPQRDAADVAFLQNMLAHHQQGIELSSMVARHTDNAALVAFAQQLSADQRAEHNGFRAQLMQWEEPLSNPDAANAAGAVDPATMAKLQRLNGPDFDKLWLQTMIAHHRGAIAMTQAEIAQGRSIDVISIAKSVAASQQAEIDQMNRLLGS